MSSKGTKSLEEVVEQLKKLVAENVAGNAQLLTRFNDFIRAATKALAAGRTGESADGAVLLSRWLDLNLASYSVATTHVLALMNGLLSAAENALMLTPAARSQTRPTPEARAELRLLGRLGDRVTSAFLVENHYDRPLDVAFESSDLVSSTVESLPSSLIAFEPATLAIAPGGQEIVQAVVTITRAFIVGQTYTATIRLLGLQTKEVGISVTVLPPAQAAEPSGPKSQTTSAEVRSAPSSK